MNQKGYIPNVSFISVGADHYDQLPTLNNVKNDLCTFREIFQSSPYSLFGENDYSEIYDCQSIDFRKKIQEYIYSRSAEQDILILYFSGHGVAIGRDDFGFCLSDAVIHPEDKIVLPISVVKFSEIVGSLYIKNVSLILIIDACYSGQVSKQLNISSPEIILEMNKSLRTHIGSYFGLITSCSSIEQIRDKGVISKALKEICDQGIEGFLPTIDFGEIAECLGERIDNQSMGDARSRIFIPSGRISKLPLCRNVKYRDRRESVNTYSFTQPYFHLLEVLWNNGKPIALKPKDILDKTGSQSAYANHKKLSLSCWDLVTSDRHKRRVLSEKGIGFIKGLELIPKTIIENKVTRICTPAPGSPLIKVVNEKDIFGVSVRSIIEVETLM